MEEMQLLPELLSEATVGKYLGSPLLPLLILLLVLPMFGTQQEASKQESWPASLQGPAVRERRQSRAGNDKE